MFSYESNPQHSVSNTDMILSPQSSVSRSHLELALVRGSVISPEEVADWLREDLIRKGGPADLSSLSPSRKRRRTLTGASSPTEDSELFSNPTTQNNGDPLRLPSTSSSSHQPSQISVAAATGRAIRHRRSQPVSSSSFYHPNQLSHAVSGTGSQLHHSLSQSSRSSDSAHNSRHTRSSLNSASSNSQRFGSTSSSQSSSPADQPVASFPPSVTAALFPEALSGPQSSVSSGGRQSSASANHGIYPHAGPASSNAYAFNASNQIPMLSGASWSSIPSLPYSAMNPWSFIQPLELHRSSAAPATSVRPQSNHYDGSNPTVAAALAYSQQQAALAAALGAVSHQHQSFPFYQQQQTTTLAAAGSQRASQFHYQPPPSYQAATSINQRPTGPSFTTFDPNVNSHTCSTSRRRGQASNLSSSSNDASSSLHAHLPHLMPHSHTSNPLWRQAGHPSSNSTPGVPYNSASTSTGRLLPDSTFLTNGYGHTPVYPHHQLDFPTLVQFFSLFVHPHETVLLNGQPCLRSRVPLNTAGNSTSGLSNPAFTSAPNPNGLAGAAHHLAAAGTNMETLFHLAAQLENRRRGLSKDELEDLPSWKYKPKEEKASSCDKMKTDIGTMEEQTKCMVCLEEFEPKQTIRMLVCGHEYHSRCVDRWLKNNRTCPMCRADAHDGTHQEESL